MKLNDNKGSTLLMLVIAIGVISLLGTSVLGVTMMNYKIKKTNTDIKEAFYMSESGLDKTYATAYDFVQEAVKESNQKAKEFISDFTLDNIEYLKITYPEIYYFCVNEIPILDEDNMQIGVSYEFNEKEIQKQAEIKFNNNFKTYIDNSLDLLYSYSNPLVTVDNLGWKYIAENSSLYKDLKLKVNSQYTNDENIKKETSVDMTVEVPKYNEPYLVSTKVIPVNPFLTKVVSAENLVIGGNSEFNGDVFITGNLNAVTPTISSIVKGDLAVKKNINLDGNNLIIKTKDIYAENIIINGNGAALETINSDNKVYIKDDLEINNANQKVVINGSYYGFSDGTNSTGPDNSSGININNYSGLHLTITDALYLYGTSYVNINNFLKYQTGESISIKGNYKAYTQPLFDVTAITKDGKDLRNVEFKDYDYLRFAEHFTDGSKLTAMDKASYIKNYNKEYKDLIIPSNININISKVHTIGSTIDEGKFEESKYIVDDNSVFKEAEKLFNIKINKLGYTIDYEGNELRDINFLSEIKLNNFPEIDNSDIKEKFIYVSKDYGTYNLSSGKYNGLVVTNEDINISENVNFSGIIITSGNITILGEFKLNGSIISNGNVTLSGNGSKIFNHNIDIISNIIAEHDLHMSIFSDSEVIDTKIVTTLVLEDDISDEIETVNVDFSKLLRFSNWKVE